MFEKGETYIIRNPSNNIEHLYFIISNPDEKDRILMVNLSTFIEDSIEKEQICILEVGDHPYVRHKSFINYAESICPMKSEIEAAIKLNLFDRDEDASPELIKNIQVGATKSEALPEKFKKYFALF
jgi:hypothetical protein